MMKPHSALEMTGAEAHKGHAIPMLRVHVRLHLEDETGDLPLIRRDLPRCRHARLWRWRETGNAPHQLAHAKGVDGRAEPDRRHMALEKALQIETRHQPSRHLDLLAELFEKRGRDMLGDFRIVQPFDAD